MPASLLTELQSVRARLVGFEPAELSGSDCTELVSELARVEKACATAKARAAARAADCGAHRAAGFGNPAEWLARQSGSSVGAARAAIETANVLSSCPQTADAVLTGEVSIEQAHEITRAEQVRPGSESELLELARSSGLGRLREEARRVRHQAEGIEEVHRRQVAARSFRHWVNDLGNIAFCGEAPPEVGAAFVNRIEAECDRLRRDAKRRGLPPEAREAYALDALVGLCGQGGRSARRGGADAVFVIDLRAFRRGHAHAGEPCHVIGGGDIPVDVAVSIVDDAFVKAVLHDGVDILKVKHVGRHIPAELRTAIALGPLPELNGLTCVEDGCERRHHLELDHIDPVANFGPTSFENLAPRCWPHHREKTERDRRAGLLAGGGGDRGGGRSP